MFEIGPQMNYLKKSILDKHVRKIEKEVPVRFLSRKSMNERTGEKDYDGAFNFSTGIYIVNTVPNYVKICILFHEYGHFLCYKNKCRCVQMCEKKFIGFSKDKMVWVPLCEAHACIYVLKALYKDQLWGTFKHEMSLVMSFEKSDDSDDKDTFEKLKKLKGWKELKNAFEHLNTQREPVL